MVLGNTIGWGLARLRRASTAIVLLVGLGAAWAEVPTHSSAPPVAAVAVPTDGSLKEYTDFSIRWPTGYVYRAEGVVEEERTYYIIGEELPESLVALRVDTLPIGGLAHLLTDNKVYEICQDKVLRQMKADQLDLQATKEGTREIGGAKFYQARLVGKTLDGKLAAQGQLFLNKRGSILYIITVMEVSQNPGPKLTQLSTALESFRFPTSTPRNR